MLARAPGALRSAQAQVVGKLSSIAGSIRPSSKVCIARMGVGAFCMHCEQWRGWKMSRSLLPVQVDKDTCMSIMSQLLSKQHCFLSRHHLRLLVLQGQGPLRSSPELLSPGESDALASGPDPAQAAPPAAPVQQPSAQQAQHPASPGLRQAGRQLLARLQQKMLAKRAKPGTPQAATPRASTPKAASSQPAAGSLLRWASASSSPQLRCSSTAAGVHRVSWGLHRECQETLCDVYVNPAEAGCVSRQAAALRPGSPTATKPEQRSAGVVPGLKAPAQNAQQVRMRTLLTS